MDNPTTRVHPRTLNEAFPQDADYAYAVERVASPLLPWRVVDGIVAVLLVAVLAALVLGWL
jgi:hypothetical protein